MGNKIQFRRGTTAPPTLDAGEPAFRTDTGILYIGNGSSNVPVNAPLNTDFVTESASDILTGESVLGTTVITSTTYAALQAAAKAGRLSLPSNSAYLLRDNGSSWSHWGPIFPFTKPTLSSFTWVNQGTATAVETNGFIHISIPATAATSFRILKKSAPATPYTITAAFMINGPTVNYNSAGLLFRESSSGKLISCATVCNTAGSTGLLLDIAKFASETSASAGSYTYIHLMPKEVYWLRIADTGANRVSSYSADGVNFFDLHSVSRTDYATANEVGFFVDCASSNVVYSASLLSWKEA